MAVIEKNRYERIMTFAMHIIALFVAVIGLLDLLGWALEIPILISWKESTQPMSPMTGLLSVLFGINLILCVRLYRSRIIQQLTILLSSVGLMLALLVLVLRLMGVYRSFEHLGFTITGIFGNVPLGHMTLVSAFCLSLAFVVLLATVLPKTDGGQLWQRSIIWVFSGLITLTGLSLLLFYPFALPPSLNDETLIHPSLNSSVVLLMIGVILILLAARFTDWSLIELNLNVVRVYPYLIVFFVFAILTVIVFNYYYRDSEEQFRHGVELQLLAVTEFKTEELVQWRKERLGDAAVAESAPLVAAVRQLIKSPGAVLAKQDIQNWLGKYLGYYGYDQVLLLDTQGSIMQSIPQVARVSATIKRSAVDSLKSHQSFLQDFYRDEYNQQVYLAVIVPVFDKENGKHPLGVIVLRIDPTASLYSRIKRWPTTNETAETLLFRRDGNEVLFLNELRFQKNPPLTLHVPLTGNAEQIAVKTVLGKRGIIEGVNYRNIAAIAAVSAIPDSPWFLAARVEKAEIYKPLRDRMWINVLLLSIVLGCGITLLILLLWRQQQLILSQKQLDLNKALLKNQAIHKSILHTVMDGFLLMDMEGRLLEVNETYCRISGYSEQELLDMEIVDLGLLGASNEIAYRIKNIVAQGDIRFEAQHRNKSGTIFEVDVSVQYQPIENGRIVIFLHDITDRKAVEQKLQLAANVFTHAREGILITDHNGAIIEVNNAFSEITGYSRDEVVGKNPSILSSGRQEKAFYETMWLDLRIKGHWYGEIWNRRKNGEVHAVIENINAVRDDSGDTLQYVALMSDISLFKEHEQKLEHSAHFDTLTNLPNRTLLSDRIRQAIVKIRRNGQRLALAFIDLDGFKAINDNYGHLVGDQLLIAAANNMKQSLREVDTIARIGGDEFVALLVDVGGLESSELLFTRLLAAAAKSMPFNEGSLQVSASIGITFYPQAKDVDADILLRQADQAMYKAKLNGKNRYHIFDVELDNYARIQNEAIDKIRRALERNEFLLYYQPKVNLRLGKIIGAEALIRWQHPEKGLLAPADFLPLIENNTLAIGVGKWVINTVMTQIEYWHDKGLNLPISINISARQLQEENFVESLRSFLAAHPKLNPGDLELEVLETSAMNDLNKVSELIKACNEMGVHFSLDDFGTGYSSLTYLKRLPVSQIKIDQSFVRDMLNDTDDLAIVEGVLALAAAFSLQVIAEGMESSQHGEMLLQLGCDLAQGYAIARPMPATELEKWLSVWKPDSSWLDRPSFMRDDLPLLFANAEHKVWINILADYLHSSAHKEQPNHISCRFGKWLNAQDSEKWSSLKTVIPLHKKLHILGVEVVTLHAKGRSKEALEKYSELEFLHEALIEALIRLIQEKWTNANPRGGLSP